MRKFLIFFLALVFIGCASKEKDIYQKIKDSGKIIVGTEGTYAPFTYHDELSNELTGFDVDVARELAKRLDLEVEFLETTWDALLAGLDTGRFDLIANQVFRNADREEAYTLSDNYMFTNAVILSSVDNPVTDLSQVAGKKAGHSVTSAYANMSREAGAEVIGIDPFNLVVENIKNKRVDYTVNDTATVAYYLAQNPDENLEAHNLDGDEFEVVFALAKEGTEELVAAVNKALDEMKADGAYKRIYTKYFSLID